MENENKTEASDENPSIETKLEAPAPTPTVGRIVFWRNPQGVQLPACIAAVRKSGAVDLSVFETTQISVCEGDDPGCWQWPKR